MHERCTETTVVIASSEDPSVFNCIDSVNNEASIAVALTPDESIESRLCQLKIPHIVVPRGNLGLTFNAGIDLAKTNKVIIMTDDATFNSGAIDKLEEGLEEFDACKARILFQYDNVHSVTKIIADARDSINSVPNRVFTPGLALKKDIKEKLGGHFFDERVLWAEDSELSYRFKQKGLSFGYIKDATINHPAVSLSHDLKGAFLIGLSKRRAVDLGLRKGDENVIPTLQRFFSGETFDRKATVFQQKGMKTLVYMIIWDCFYNLGYNLRRLKLSNSIEKKIWLNFGRNDNK